MKGAAITGEVVLTEGNTGGPTEFTIVKDTGSATGKIDIIAANDAGSLELDRHSDSIMFDTKWHHIAWADTNGTAKLYIDGVPDTADFNYSRDGVFTFNRTTIGATHTGSFAFNGNIDDVRVYDRALSPAEILKPYQAGAVLKKPPNNLRLVGCWSFDEGTSTKATDFSGNENTATTSGTNSTWVSGKRGNAVALDNSDDVFKANHSASLNALTAMTISLWVKRNSVSDINAWVSKSDTGGTSGWFLEGNDDGGIFLSKFGTGEGTNSGV